MSKLCSVCKHDDGVDTFKIKRLKLRMDVNKD